jgi:ribosome-associated translation inhibitor RaiA
MTQQEETRTPPVSITGLDENDPDSQVGKEKFLRSIEALGHTERDILEARATVKTHSIQKDRRRFEVHVVIRTSRGQHDIDEEGWSVAEVFENIGQKIKGLMTKPQERRDHHRRPSRGEIETARYAE